MEILLFPLRGRLPRVISILSVFFFGVGVGGIANAKELSVLDILMKVEDVKYELCLKAEGVS